MFERKYMFETTDTKLIRRLKNIVFWILLIFITYAAIGTSFILYAGREQGIAENSLFQRPPDLIVVFTGDKGRIPRAVELSKKLGQPKIFITGVNSRNNVSTILSQNADIDHLFIDIDYYARNTVENVLATLRYLRANQGHKRILIVTHDYHLFRVKQTVNRILSKNDDYEFHYHGVNTNFGNFRSIKILSKEVYKTIRALLFLLLWEERPR